MIQPKPNFGLPHVQPSSKATTAIEVKPNISPNNFLFKMIFGTFTIAIVAGLQLAAWQGGHDGMIFAFTSTVIGLTIGSCLGFEWGVKHGSN